MNNNIIGIIPRSVEKLFDGVAEADENIEFTFKVNYIEIYMEKIRDLLDPNHLKVILIRYYDYYYHYYYHYYDYYY